MRWFILTLVALIATPMASCTGASDPMNEDRMSVELEFVGQVGAEAYNCGQEYTGVGTGDSTFTPRDFRLYIADIELLRDDGTAEPLALDSDGKWQTERIGLLDFDNDCARGSLPEEADLNNSLSGLIATDDYTGIRFTLGVPFDLNHQDQTMAAGPLSVASMFWSWQAGYKFLRVDASSYRVHLGSTGCDGDARGNVTSCTNANRPTITLTDFDPATQRIVVDIGAMLSTANIEESGDDDPGCMSVASDPDCAPLFTALGVNEPSEQTLFRVQ